MKIKITKGHAWYMGLVGCVFDVDNETELGGDLYYHVTVGGIADDYMVDAKNCEVIMDKPNALAYKKSQAEWVKEKDIEVGELVKITRAFKVGEQGYSDPMPNYIEDNDLIGELVCIVGIDEDDIIIELLDGSDSWVVPYFILETGNTTSKPPLGIMPRKLYIEQRIKALETSIVDYMRTGTHVPSEWLKEYVELTRTV